MRIAGGIYKGRKLIVPKGVSTIRPTFTKLKQSVFNICGSYIENAFFLDLFAGVGGMACEALSRGAKEVILVEKEKKALKAISENIQLLGVHKQVRVMQMDVFEALKKLYQNKKEFDLIYADPPYGTLENSLTDQVLQYIDRHPLLKKGGELFLEDALEAYDDSYELKSLKLKSKRKLGRALLRQYIYE